MIPSKIKAGLGQAINEQKFEKKKKDILVNDKPR
jgi:hypothetical protein